MSALNELIDSYIKRNAAQAITGDVLNGVLNAIADTLAGGSLLKPGTGEGGVETATDVQDVTLEYTGGTVSDYEIDINCTDARAYQVLSGAKSITIGENTYHVMHVDRDSSVDFIIITQEEVVVAPATGSIVVHGGAGGDGSIAAGDMAHAPGDGAVAVGVASASGRRSLAAGYNVVAHNEMEIATGQYNNTSWGDGSIFSVGCGTGEGARRNAIHVRRFSGQVKVYVIGVGGYNGDNPGTAQDLATVINSL